MFLQLAASIILILGGIYILYCLGRAAASMDRLASAVEDWVELQKPTNTYVPPAAPSVPAIVAPNEEKI
ncbi:MAG: hypothetical protein ABI210_06405 [Abditibacteriaceae bacterium]